MGEPKGQHFGTVVTELERMRHGGNQWAEDVFGELTDAQVRRQVLDLGPQMDTIIAALPPSLRETVRLRYEDMLAQTEHITPTPERVETAAGGLPPRPAELGGQLPFVRVGELSGDWKVFRVAERRAGVHPPGDRIDLIIRE